MLHRQDLLDQGYQGYDSSPTSLDPDGEWLLVKSQDELKVYQYSGGKSDSKQGHSIFKSVAIVEAASEDIFHQVMDLSACRRKWDPAFQSGEVVEVKDGHTNIVHETLPRLWNAKPRDYCLLRYWRRTDMGVYEVYLFSTQHPACPHVSGCVRAKILSVGFVISPLKADKATGFPRSLVEHMVEVDSQGWSGLLCSISHHHEKLRTLMLQRVTGLQKLFVEKRNEVPFEPRLSDDDDDSRGRSRSKVIGALSVQASPRSDTDEPSSPRGESGRHSPVTRILVEGPEGRDGDYTEDESDTEDFFDAEEDACCAFPLEAANGSKMADTITLPVPSPKSPFKVAIPAIKIPVLSLLSPSSSRRDSGLVKTTASPSSAKSVGMPTTAGTVAPDYPLKPLSSTATEDSSSSSSSFDFASVGSFPRAPDSNPLEPNSWAQPPGHLFKVRQATYFTDKAKGPGGDCFLQAVAVDWFSSDVRMDHVLGHPKNRVRLALESSFANQKNKPTIFVVNLQIPGKTHYSAVAYFLSTAPMESNKHLSCLVHGSDTFRNNHFKMIPRVHEGPWIVRRSVGDVACLLGKALDITYHVGPHYFEMDVDVGSSMVATGILRIALSYINAFTIDLAFLVQGESPEDLPEELLGTLRLTRANLASAVPYPYR